MLAPNFCPCCLDPERRECDGVGEIDWERHGRFIGCKLHGKSLGIPVIFTHGKKREVYGKPDDH